MAATKSIERTASVIMTVVSVAYLAGAYLLIPVPMIKQQVGPAVFPRAVGFLLLLISVCNLYVQFKGMVKEDEARAVIIGAEDKVETKADLKLMGIILALMAAYAVTFETLGYPITTFVVFIAGALVLDRKHMVRDVIIAIISSFGMFYVFTKLLHVTLPAGPLSLFGL
jgi:putative tricarboxylic transport membrane protein